MLLDPVQFLLSLETLGVKFGLEKPAYLLNRLGNPHLKFNSVHVGGTDGKGSTTAFLRSILRQTGLKVASYTSPHLVRFSERIEIDGREISQEDLHRASSVVKPIVEEMGNNPEMSFPTFFEAATALAFHHFAEKGVDIAVVEVGMGGRLDVTNLITPLVSIITSVNIEHTQYLGNTIQEIAREKAGIIKEGTPVVSAVIQREALNIIEKTCAEKRSPLFLLGRDFQADSRPESLHGSAPRRFMLDFMSPISPISRLELGLPGRFQADNAALAVMAALLLSQKGIPINEQRIRDGLARATWPGRLDLRRFRGRDILLDCAHCPSKAEKLAQALQEEFPHRKIITVLAILNDKDARGVVQTLAAACPTIIATQVQSNRTLDADSLTKIVGEYADCIGEAPTISDAMEKAADMAGADDLVVVTGSLYAVGEAMEVTDR